MLPQLLSLYPDLFESVAASWLESGATSFALLDDAGCIAHWPETAVGANGAVSHPLTIMGRTLGALQVTGLPETAVGRRLAADAQMIAKIARLEGDLDEITGELVNNQDQLLALYELTQSTRKQWELTEVMAQICSKVQRLFNTADAFIIFAPEHGELLIRGSRPDAQYPATAENLLTLVRASEQYLLLSGNNTTYLLNIQQDNLLAMPIRLRNQIDAVLVMRDKPKGFATPDIKLAQAIADHAGAQMENALLYRETLRQARLNTEMDLARQVQTLLLPPQAPSVPGLDVFAASQPALQVGGDFFDFVAQPQRPFFFTLGDVAGKGISAAMLMTMTRTSIRSSASFLTDPSPQTVLDQVNAELYQDFTEVSMFATAFVGQYEAAQQRLTFANAGHSPVIYCPAHGDAKMLQADGTAVGILPDNLATNQQLPFGPGDLLIVATDGFSEAEAENGVMFGYERLLALVNRLAPQSAAIIGQTLFQAVADFAGGHPQADDQTLVVLKGDTT